MHNIDDNDDDHGDASRVLQFVAAARSVRTFRHSSHVRVCCGLLFVFAVVASVLAENCLYNFYSFFLLHSGEFISYANVRPEFRSACAPPQPPPPSYSCTSHGHNLSINTRRRPPARRRLRAQHREHLRTAIASLSRHGCQGHTKIVWAVRHHGYNSGRTHKHKTHTHTQLEFSLARWELHSL